MPGRRGRYRDAPPLKPPTGPVVTVESSSRTSRGAVAGLASCARPHQWIKNLLVLAAPGAAGMLDDPSTAGRAGLALLCFLATSVGVYLVNDVVDREADAAHPVKRHRPVAAGVVSPHLAVTAAVAAIVLGLGVGAWLTGGLAVVLGVYVALNLGYDLGLRDVPLVDLAVVAAGFVLRALAGGAATGIAVSKWFVIVISFASLYVVIGKRSAELRDRDTDVTATRPVLEAYSPALLRDLRVTTAAVAIGGYVLWAFESARFVDASFFELSIIPFVLAMYRYAMVIDAGGGQAPEDAFLGDGLLQVFVAVWIALFGLGAYVA